MINLQFLVIKLILIVSRLVICFFLAMLYGYHVNYYLLILWRLITDGIMRFLEINQSVNQSLALH